MCEFITTPRSCARRGNPACGGTRNAGGALSWGHRFFGHAKKGCEKELKDFLFVLFFVRSQSKVPKEKPPAAWPSALLAKTINTASSQTRPDRSGLRHVTPFSRVHELRSAALQRVLKHRILNIKNGCRITCGMTFVLSFRQKRSG